MRTDDLDFDLPRELIATRPAEPRDASRLLVVSRSDPDRLEHRVFSELPELLKGGDTLVFNRSRVIPARFEGENIQTGGRVTGLYLREIEVSAGDERPRWVVLIKAKRARVGGRVGLVDAFGGASEVTLELIETCDSDGPGAWVVAVEGAGPNEPAASVLERSGRTPLPPYILSARRERGDEPGDDWDRAHYQTVYAGAENEAGSVAAPTAGLHFTDRVFEGLDQRGVDRKEVVLHVGAGTFRPVETDDLEDHPMHREWCHLGSAGGLVTGERAGRVIAVGSTSVRTLESAAVLAADPAYAERARSWFETKILIAPGYRWRLVDGMVTNFHLPRSTLIAMVAAALEYPGIDGVERVKAVYAEAIREGYRFFSYGDAMVVLP
ncbi:MAG: tRNA preQ1(34) S-adenosylmethionine ribosyltransferase-isomerase QueA [Phycisphaerales bacterium]